MQVTGNALFMFGGTVRKYYPQQPLTVLRGSNDSDYTELENI